MKPTRNDQYTPKPKAVNRIRMGRDGYDFRPC